MTRSFSDSFPRILVWSSLLMLSSVRSLLSRSSRPCVRRWVDGEEGSRHAAFAVRHGGKTEKVEERSWKRFGSRPGLGECGSVQRISAGWGRAGLCRAHPRHAGDGGGLHDHLVRIQLNLTYGLGDCYHADVARGRRRRGRGDVN